MKPLDVTYTVTEVKGISPGQVLVTADKDGFQQWPSSEPELFTYRTRPSDAPRVGDTLRITVVPATD